MGTVLLRKLADKSMSKDELRQTVERDFDLLPMLLTGLSSQKAAIRYGCAKVLVDLSLKYPKQLYPYINDFIALLDSKYRILTWNAMAIIANLTKVDKEQKFDSILEKYYRFINDQYMVTVANVVGNSSSPLSLCNA